MEKVYRKHALNTTSITLFKGCVNYYFGKGLSKNPKTVNFLFFFRTQSLLMDKVIKNKTLLELVTSHSSGYKASSQ